MQVIGIDPGESTGFAYFKDGALEDLWTLKPMSAIKYLGNNNLDIGALFVMEDSRLQSFVFERGTSQPAKLKIARNVGQIDGLCRLYEEALAGLPLIRLSPMQKGAKITDDNAFRQMTGWGKKTNQHCRDAAILAWRFRNGVAL